MSTPAKTHKGKPIRGNKLIVMKMGDGLSKSVGIAPVEFSDEVHAYIVARVIKQKERHDAVRDDDGDVRSYDYVQILDALSVTPIDGDLVIEVVAEMEGRIAEAALAEAEAKEKERRKKDGDWTFEDGLEEQSGSEEAGLADRVKEALHVVGDE